MAVSAALVEDDNGVATMKSEETHELLEGFHDSELQLAGSAAVERHLCTCPFFCLATFNRHKTLRTRVRKAWPHARFASLESAGHGARRTVSQPASCPFVRVGGEPFISDRPRRGDPSSIACMLAARTPSDPRNHRCACARLSMSAGRRRSSAALPTTYDLGSWASATSPRPGSN